LTQDVCIAGANRRPSSLEKDVAARSLRVSRRMLAGLHLRALSWSFRPRIQEPALPARSCVPGS